MARKDIYKEAAKAGVQWKKGQSGNPNGRPKKWCQYSKTYPLLAKVKNTGHE